MSTLRTQVGTAALTALLLVGVSACTEPDPDPPVRVTGDPTEAIPETTTTEAETAPPETTTTLFFG